MFELHTQILVNFSTFFSVGILFGISIGLLSFVGAFDLLRFNKK